jgi:tRNA pseudouridine55 synthase
MIDFSLADLKEGRLLLFDKPMNWTSFDLVNKVRIVITSALGEKKLKVGHAGTLDPLATGLMILCTGRETKSITTMIEMDKEYVGTFRLGATTPSFDLETEPDAFYPVSHITNELIDAAIVRFKGEQLQTPPAYSAKFIDGKRAYKYARQGDIREPMPVKINIKELEVMKYSGEELTVRVLCSKGTYIRSLARDMGIALGSGAHLTELKRTRIGSYELKDAMPLASFEEYIKLLKQTVQ